MLEHGCSPLHFAQSVAIPDELRADPELRLDAQSSLEQKRRLGRDALLTAENASDFADGYVHALSERSLRQATGLDELFAKDLAGTLRRLGRWNADREDQAETG